MEGIIRRLQRWRRERLLLKKSEILERIDRADCSTSDMWILNDDLIAVEKKLGERGKE